MRTIKHLAFAIVLAVTTLLSSCSSSDGDGGGGGSTALGTMKAKIAGSNWSSMSAATAATHRNTVLIIQGSDATGKAIQLMAVGVTAAGTFQINDTSAIDVVASYTQANISNPMASLVFAAPYEGSGTVGTLTVTDLTATNVKGTFSFTGKNQSGADTKQVTDGVFNVNLTN